MPLFTIITIVYNSGKFLQETIESVLAQQYTDFEYVIADDCSTDNSWEIIQRYTDPRIKAMRNGTNKGEYGNRTHALQQATGQYVIYIDGDDIIYDHALQVFAEYVNRFPECAMLFTREWDHRILFPYKVEPADIYRFEYLDRGIMGGNFTKVLFKTEVLKKYSFPGNVRSGDTYIQLKIAQQYAGLAIPDGLTWWRRRAGNATEKLFQDDRHLVETISYRIGLLDEGCPLPESEKDWAKTNIYGLYLRQLLKMALRLKWPMLFYLMKRIQVPKGYYKSLFKSARTNYYNHITGDKPLHSNHINKQILLNNSI